VTTFSSRIEKLYAADPERTVIHWMLPQQPDRPMSCGELVRRAAGYAAALDSADIRPGEVVILILQHSEALAASFFGAVLHGAIPAIMPFLTEKLSPDSYRRSLKSLFEVSRPAAAITYPEFEAEVRAAIPAGGSVRSVLLSGGISPCAAPDFSAMRGREREEDDTVLLQHSSGTTGLQKGVALSHRSVFRQLDCYAKAIRLRPEDTIVSWLPLYHDMGLIAGFLMPLLEGIPLVLMSPFDWVRAPYKLMQTVSRHKGTLSWMPNFAYNFCAQKVRERHLEGVDLSSWRAVSNCSEPMHYQSHRMFLERFRPFGLREEALATCYAMAENVFAVTQGGIDRPVTVDSISRRGLLQERVARPAEGKESMNMLSCGPPLENAAVKVVDDNRRELPERHLGEVMLRSDCMLNGYYRRDDLTGKAFHDGWLLTGDLGYLADGEVYITGRKKDLIIVGGKNVYPQDLESLASEVPGIHPGRVVAFGVDNEEMGTEEVVIVAEMDPEEGDAGSEETAGQLSEEIRTRVTRGSDIALRQVKVVGRGWLLKTSSGKIARNANREKYIAEKSLGAVG
jgi:fatty-acyl-CoA synthase